MTTVGDIISYDANYRDRIYGRVTAIGSATIHVTTTDSITNVNGALLIFLPLLGNFPVKHILPSENK